MPGLYERLISDIQLIEEKVARLLHDEPKTRDSDPILVVMFWDKFDNFKHKYFIRKFHDITSPETITRCRRAIQNDCGLFLPVNDNIRKDRKIKQEAFRDWATLEKNIFK